MLEEDLDIEKKYMKTLPGTPNLKFNGEDEKITSKFEKKMNISSSIKEAPS